jgi:hypothetical protein
MRPSLASSSPTPAALPRGLLIAPGAVGWSAEAVALDSAEAEVSKILSRSRETELLEERRPRQEIRHRLLTACGVESWLASRTQLSITPNERWYRYEALRKVVT